MRSTLKQGLAFSIMVLVIAASSVLWSFSGSMQGGTFRDPWYSTQYREFTANWRNTFSEARNLVVNESCVALWWIYNAGFLVKTPKRVIAFDLYLPWAFDLKDEDFDMIDVLCITHQHDDHYSPYLISKIGNRTLIVTPPSLTIHAREGAKTANLGWWENTTYSDITVTALPSMHDEEGFANGYLITTDNGIRIIHTDDNEYCYPDMFKIGQTMRPNVLLVNPTSGSMQTALIVRALGPEYVVFTHLYEFFIHLSGIWTYERVNNVKENLAKQYPNVRVIMPSLGEKYIYSKPE